MGLVMISNHVVVSNQLIDPNLSFYKYETTPFWEKMIIMGFRFWPNRKVYLIKLFIKIN